MRKIPVLLYTYGTVLLSITHTGLRRSLYRLSVFCKEEVLKINYLKIKVIFGDSWHLSRWSIVEFPVDQSKAFKYLGITFSNILSWKAHTDIIIL